MRAKAIILTAVLLMFFSYAPKAPKAMSEDLKGKVLIDDHLADNCPVDMTPGGKNAIYTKQNPDGTKSIIKYNFDTCAKTVLNKMSKKPYINLSSSVYFASNQYVCWAGDRQLYAYSLNKNIEKQVTTKQASFSSFSVASHYAFWFEHWKRENGQRYMGIYYKDLDSDDEPTCIWEPHNNRNFQDLYCHSFEYQDNAFYAFHDFNDGKSRILLFDAKEKKLKTLVDTDKVEYFLSSQNRYVFYIEYDKSDPPPYFALAHPLESATLKRIDITNNEIKEIAKLKAGARLISFSLSRDEPNQTIISITHIFDKTCQVFLYEFESNTMKKLFENNLDNTISISSFSYPLFCYIKSGIDSGIFIYNLEKDTLTKIEDAVRSINHICLRSGIFLFVEYNLDSNSKKLFYVKLD